MRPPSVGPSLGPSASVGPPSLGPSASQPARTQLTSPPAVQQLSRSHPMRSSPGAIRSVAAHPVQQGAALVSSHSPRPPPVISAITPSNRRAAGEVRSAAPHLQPCRPPIVGAPISPDTSSSAPPQLGLPQISSKPVQLPSQPVPLPQAPRPPSPNLIAQNSAGVQGGIPALSHPPGFTQGLVADRQPHLPENRNPPGPDISSTFHPLEQSNFEMLGNVVGNQTSAAEPDVVCLSDDE